MPIAYALIAIVALLHLYFLVLEMFLWTTDKTIATFGMTREFAEASATLAANQGLYNGFLAAGLIFALLKRHEAYFATFARFFLICVVVAGLYGGYSVGPRILIVQALPAALALGALAIKK